LDIVSAVAQPDGRSQERRTVICDIRKPDAQVILRDWLAESGRDTAAVYCATLTPGQLTEVFRNTEEIFSDLDGTLMEHPSAFWPDMIAALKRLNDVGVVPTFVTGKPLSEATAVLDMLRPQGVHARMMFERGAYELIPSAGRHYEVSNLLATPEVEGVIADLKREFWGNQRGIRHALEQTYGVSIAPAGDGTHKCIFSIDIFRRGMRVAQSIDPHRMDIKVDVRLAAVQAMIGALQRDIETYLAGRCKGCTVADLGNANLEITARLIEKHVAIAVTSAFTDQRQILLWGDSGNDEHMMQLRTHPNIHAGVVFHEATPDCLVQLGDFFAIGRGNGLPFINAVVEAKQAL
jgi:HAD superfamily hydrolase (TIGR01484 family)